MKRVGAALRAWRTWLVVAPWIACAIVMVLDHLGDPFDPTREGTARYGHNGDGEIFVVLAISLVELAVFLAILRPWSYRATWPRSLAALALAVPITMAGLFFTMHAGGVMAAHALWLLTMTLGCVVAIVIGLVSKMGAV